jgi:hypothetical protein
MIIGLEDGEMMEKHSLILSIPNLMILKQRILFLQKNILETIWRKFSHSIYIIE